MTCPCSMRPYGAPPKSTGFGAPPKSTDGGDSDEGPVPPIHECGFESSKTTPGLVSLSPAFGAPPKSTGSVLQPGDEGYVSPVPIFDLSVSFNIITGFVYTFQNWRGDTVQKYNVLKCLDVAPILSEVNRIWRVAGIRFHIKRCITVPAIPGRLGPRDIFDHRQLDDPKALNVYFIPFLKSPVVGVQNGGLGNLNGWIEISEWDLRPRSHGLLGFTLAHEFGHGLGLDHTGIQTRLMSGAGGDLSPAEIKVSRRYAAKFADRERS